MNTVPPIFVLQQMFDTVKANPQKVALVLDDQVWTYGELMQQIQYVVQYLYSLNVSHGEIVYQFVERGFEMVCGLFGIMYVGGVYCPINPIDPSDRVSELLQQLQGRYVLLHQTTVKRFPSSQLLHIILMEEILLQRANYTKIENLPDCKQHGAAFIICTSGTTGKQKAVVHTHKSFAASTASLAQWDIGLYSIHDHVLQVASCSWILHLVEISLSIVLGGTLVLLRPSGHLDIAYFARSLVKHQITTLTLGAGLIRAVTNYLETSQEVNIFQSVRNLCTTGN